jgi:hypothetical protein
MRIVVQKFGGTSLQTEEQDLNPLLLFQLWDAKAAPMPPILYYHLL